MSARRKVSDLRGEPSASPTRDRLRPGPIRGNDSTLLSHISRDLLDGRDISTVQLDSGVEVLEPSANDEVPKEVALACYLPRALQQLKLSLKP